MLAKFKVKGFKNFYKELVFDLEDAKNYEFNQECVRNGIVKTALMYGPNGSGKSNLGKAIFDIVLHLTDKNKELDLYYPYFNLDLETKEAEFYYKFKFDDGVVEYSYTKQDVEVVKKEELKINGDIVISFDESNTSNFVKLKGGESLNLSLDNKKLSFVKYVYKNTNLNKNDKNNIIFFKFFDFIERMLFFRSLKDNRYIGFTNGSEKLAEGIIKENKVKDFQEFLAVHGISYQLEVDDIDQKKILCRFKNGKSEFFEIASTGTQSLMLFYFWLLKLKEASLVFVDEFDAFYHSDTSKKIVKTMLGITNTQNILTTHNTDIMTNDLLRPDCYFILEGGNACSVVNCTNKELRFVHNLQKMYKAGAFTP